MRVPLAAAAALVLLAGPVTVAQADEACPSGMSCTPPSQPVVHEESGAATVPGTFDANPVQAGLVESMGLYEVPVLADDVDDDLAKTKAKKCWTDTTNDIREGNVADRVDPLPRDPILWRWTHTESILIYKWCQIRISSVEYRYTYKPLDFFFAFQMDETSAIGTTPRYFCQAFRRFHIDALVRDGFGKSIDIAPLDVPCVEGWFGNSGYAHVPITAKRLHHNASFGYPKWDATIKVVITGFPDYYLNDVSGRLNPNN